MTASLTSTPPELTFLHDVVGTADDPSRGSCRRLRIEAPRESARIDGAQEDIAEALRTRLVPRVGLAQIELGAPPNPKQASNRLER